MPACTITSHDELTAESSCSVFPPVLIGMMPASRIGDNACLPDGDRHYSACRRAVRSGLDDRPGGHMPQSRVTDQLVCVGPPDIAAMGCETVLVGMAGAGGAAGACGWHSGDGRIRADAVAGPASPPGCNGSCSKNGTVKTSAPAGGRLPPITIQQPGWPDLPAKETPNFQSVQPVEVPPDTMLYRVIDDNSDPAGSYWTPNLPADEDSWRSELCRQAGVE